MIFIAFLNIWLLGAIGTVLYLHDETEPDDRYPQAIRCLTRWPLILWKHIKDQS